MLAQASQRLCSRCVVSKAVRLKILVVDDEPDMVASLSRILLGRGFDVSCACDGKDAITQNLVWEPDAVIMDIRMPRMNGIEACLELLRVRMSLLVILMTGFSEALDEANESIFAEADRNGRVVVMMKPLDLDRVMDLLQTEEERAPSAVAPDNVVGWLETVGDRSGRPANGKRPRNRPE